MAGVLMDGEPANPLPQAWGDWGEAAWFPHLLTKDQAYVDTEIAVRQASAKAAAGSPPPSPYRCRCERAGTVEPLPRPSRLADALLSDALLRRRTTRGYTDDPLSVQQLGDILFYTGGPLFEEEVPGFGRVLKKCSPSPGARHATELYCALRRGGELPAGLYHYCTAHHALARLRGGDDLDVGGFLEEVLVEQPWFWSAPLVVFLTCVRERLAWKYPSPRAYRVAHLESGHYAQTLVLVAVALGLGAFQTGAFADSKIEAALGIDGVEEFVMYAAGAGTPLPGVTYPRLGLRLSEHLPEGAGMPQHGRRYTRVY